MAEPMMPDTVREAFADLTGELEHAALIAAEAQALRTVDEAQQRCHALVAGLERMLLRLRQLQGSLG